MNGAELIRRLQPDELQAADTILAGAEGMHLYLEGYPRRQIGESRLPQAMRLVDSFDYVLTVLDGVWGDGLTQ